MHNTVWFLWIMLPWTWDCGFLFKILILIILDIFIPRSWITTTYITSIFKFLRKIFPQFYIPTNCIQRFQFLHILALLFYSHRNIDLATMFRPQYFWEILRIQLISYSTLKEHRTEKGLIEIYVRNSFTLPVFSAFPSRHRSAAREIPLAVISLLGKGQHWGFHLVQC